MQGQYPIRAPNPQAYLPSFLCFLRRIRYLGRQIFAPLTDDTISPGRSSGGRMTSATNTTLG